MEKNIHGSILCGVSDLERSLALVGKSSCNSSLGELSVQARYGN
jgi:hypothetical protein